MKEKVLVVDDDPLTRMDFCQIFAAAKYRVVGQAKDGFEAVEACRALRPDVVMMDVKMPVFGGLEAAKTIVREELCLCVVIVTAYNDAEIIQRAERCGVMAYLVKPVSEKELIPAVSVALSRSREMARMKAEMEQINKNLRDGRIIEQAKGVLAAVQGVSEAEAFARMRKMSMDNRCPLSRVAGRVIEEYSGRSVINRAKAVLMDRLGMTEEAADDAMKRMAKGKKTSLRRIAEGIIEGGV